MQMKSIFSNIIFILLFCSFSNAGETTIDGHYYGFNLVVLNPSYGDGFCVTEVLVNSMPTKDEINSNTFEIDFTLLNVKFGDSVCVVIRYHESCEPKIINPYVLLTDQTFSFTYAKFDRNGKINWAVKGNPGEDAFIIEQFRWNKWIELGEKAISDTVRAGYYSFKPMVHSGLNKFRILRYDANGMPYYSKIIKYNNIKMKPITLDSYKVSDFIEFSDETMYEIFDMYGVFITDGYGKEIDATELEKGKYYLSFDNITTIITKK